MNSARHAANLVTLLSTVAVCLASVGCARRAATVPEAVPPTAPESAASEAPRHATGFSVVPCGEGHLVTVSRPWPGAETSYTYLLLPRDAEIPAGAPDEAKRIDVPVERAIVLQTPILAQFEMLNATEAIAALETARFVTSEAIRAEVAGGRIAEVGGGESLDLERVLDLEPDVILCASYGNPDTDVAARLERAGLPVLIDSDWTEPTPLGRAQWLELIGLLLGKGEEARRRFAEIARDYEDLASRARAEAPQPSVMLNTDYQGTWYVPGGASYQARLIADAGGRYLWADDPGEGTLTVGFETVLEKGRDADVWLNAGTLTTLAELRAQDERYGSFSACERGEVYSQTGGMTADGALDYWERGVTRPDLALRDLVSVLHPQLVPGHEALWIRRLTP